MNSLKTARLPFLALALSLAVGCVGQDTLSESNEEVAEDTESTSQALTPSLPAQTLPIGILDLKVNRAAFENQMNVQLSQASRRIMGYQFALVKGGSLVAEDAGGWARAPQDGGVRMTVNHPVNIGSTQKLVTSVAMLGVMEGTLEGSPHANANLKKTLDQQLDTRVWPYLPTKWQGEMGAGVSSITFRDLLTHSSGFRMGGGPFIYDYIEDGTAGQPKTRVYANMNMAIFTQLLPFYAHPINHFIFDAMAQPFAPGSQEYRQTYAPFFEDYLQVNLFNRTTPPIRPSCDPAVDYGAQGKMFALHYTSSADLNNGTATSEKQRNDSCQGQGGYLYSSRDLAAWVGTFAGTQKFVSTGLRAKMYEDDDANERLGWSFVFTSTPIQNRFGTRLPYAGGDTGLYHATIVELPGNYYGIAMTNSDIAGTNPGSWELTRMIANSWWSALEN